MLTNYIRVAMRKATYEILPGSTLYGEISGLQGVYANAVALDDCCQELQEVLDGQRTTTISHPQSTSR